jgi:hypothetical protein
MRNFYKVTVLIQLLCLTSLFAQEDVAITITNANLGLIREDRVVELVKGDQEIRLEKIPAEIDPTSVLIENPDNSFKVLEQNYEFDLINVDKLLNKSLGYRIQISHPQQGTIEGTLLASSNQNIVLRDGDRQLQIIPRNSEQRIQLLDYESTKSNFTSRPTLVWKVISAKSGKHPMNLSYLTSGMDWQADYVGLLNKDDTELSIAAWVTVTNTSGGHYKNAHLKLMAGDINIIKQRRPKYSARVQTMDDLSVGGFQEKSFFEYHLYTLDRKTDLLNNQVKQIQLFPEVTSSISKRYRVESTDPEKVKIIVSIKNSKENNLGMPLPEGKIRVYKSDGEDIEFVGENLIRHTAKDEQLDVEVGSAFDIVSERKVISTDRKMKRARRHTIEYHLRNHKDSAVTIEILERLSPYYEVELHQSSVPLVEKEAGYLKFNVGIAADQEKILSIDYSTRW